MPATTVVHSNSITRTMTIADVRGFLRSCDAEDLPEDAVVRVRPTGRNFGTRRIIEISADARERLTEERNEPAAVRQALGLPSAASSEEVFQELGRRQQDLDELLRRAATRLGPITPEGIAVRELIGLAPDCDPTVMLQVLGECLERSVSDPPLT